MEVLNVKGMMCEGCEKRVVNALSEVDEIKNVEASHKDGTVKFETDGDIEIDKIKSIIEDLGYETE